MRIGPREKIFIAVGGILVLIVILAQWDYRGYDPIAASHRHAESSEVDRKKALSACIELIGVAQQAGILESVDPRTNEALVKGPMWAYLNYEQKRTTAALAARYVGLCGMGNRVSIRDAQSGRILAEYSGAKGLQIR